MMLNNALRFAVVGNPVTHSLSPIIHQLFAESLGLGLSYEKIQSTMPGFTQQVSNFFKQGGRGLNITSPVKEHAFLIAQHPTKRCLKAGAANTLWWDENELYADNTDGVGLLRDLIHYIDLKNKRILILGAGGAVRGILAPLIDAQPALLAISNRTLEKASRLCYEFSVPVCTDLSQTSLPFDLIINATTPEFSSILPSSILTTNTICYDLSYSQTSFLSWAKKQGCYAVDGLGMLVEQAAEAFLIWHGIMPDVRPVLTQLRSKPAFVTNLL